MLIKCKKCGFENQMGAIFCRGCGEKIDMDAMDPDTLAKSMKGSNFGKIMKIIGKTILILIILALLGAVASAFVTYKLPRYKAAPAEALNRAETKLNSLVAAKLNSILPNTEFTMDEINILLKKRFYKKADKTDANKPAKALSSTEIQIAAATKNAKTNAEAAKAETDKEKKDVIVEQTSEKEGASAKILKKIKNKFVMKNIMVQAAGKNMNITVYGTAFGYVPLRFEFIGMLEPGTDNKPICFNTKCGKIGYLPLPGAFYDGVILKQIASSFNNEELILLLKRATSIEMKDDKLVFSFVKKDQVLSAL